MSKKTVSILHQSPTGLSATNAKKRNVWKAKEMPNGTTEYSFSHVEELQPTLTEEEFIELAAKFDSKGDSDE